MPKVHMKRVYDEPLNTDGKRILVDRLWPRGITKDAAKVDEWLKILAPSNELRQWFQHDPVKFKQFKEKYLKELAEEKEKIEGLNRLIQACKHEQITLIYAAKDTKHNQAIILQEKINQSLK